MAVNISVPINIQINVVVSSIPLNTTHYMVMISSAKASAVKSKVGFMIRFICVT